TGPDGNLYVTSLSNGAVYKVSRRVTPPPPNPRPVVLNGTGGDDRFVIRLQPGNATVLQTSTDGGNTFTSVALTDVSRVEVNGGAGDDTLTIDNQFGLVAKSAGLPIMFHAGTGDDRLVLSGDPGASVTEVYLTGAAVGAGMVTTTSAMASQT